MPARHRLLQPPPQQQANYSERGDTHGPYEGHPAETAMQRHLVQWYPSCATLPRNTQYDHAVYASISGTSTAAPTSMKAWLEAGAAAICSVMLLGTRYGNMLMPRPTKDSPNTASVSTNGASS